MNNPKHQPVISVGILTAEKIRIKLSGPFSDAQGNAITGEINVFFEKGEIAFQTNSGNFHHTKELLLTPGNGKIQSFTLFDVIIGIGFHWQKKEDQSFRGQLRIICNQSGLTAVNILPLEDYLKSVISSEMKATSSSELLKAHAVISRSWLMAQIEKRRKSKMHWSEKKHDGEFNENERIKWYDREDHADFDVCADDHCQRYQGITRTTVETVEEAVTETTGEVLVYENVLCDSRFSKCCGGVTEVFENVWEPVHHPYLKKLFDSDDSHTAIPDLTNEVNAAAWIMNTPPAFCNTTDRHVLSQVLNDYDQTTHDFYRWTVRYASDELGKLIKTKTGIDFGDILELIPVERGVSGRIIRLRIVGTISSMVIGKELEIRKALSKSHLYSSAFIVNKEISDGRLHFILHGAGWGHGVGLCQIGAAVMGSKGYHYRRILKHYYRGAEIVKRY